jgi:hypothetical protein
MAGEDARVFQRTILTAVVAAGLYAGTRSQQDKRALDELCQAYHVPRAPHGLTPPFCCAAPKHFRANGLCQPFSRSIDCIGSNTAGATLVTENSRDFARWNSLLVSARKALKLFNPS